MGNNSVPKFIFLLSRFTLYRETARMRKYGESKTTRIMMATVPDVTSGLGLRKFQADGFLLTRVYNTFKA